MANTKLVRPKLNPSHSRESALRYFKVVLKYQILTEDVEEEQFTSELMVSKIHTPIQGYIKTKQFYYILERILNHNYCFGCVIRSFS